MLQIPARNAKSKTAQPKTIRLPAYRERVPYGQAVVTLTDSTSKRRKDYWLGEYGSAASHETYHRVLAEWELRGRRLPPPLAAPKPGADGNDAVTVNEVVLAYWKHASSYYTPAAAGHIKTMIRLTRKLFGHTPATAFGPNDLRLVREAMIKGDLEGNPPRKPWSRCYVNSQVHRLCRVFKWAASVEMVSVEVYHRLKSVPALRRGRSAARETDAVKPVAVELVDAVRPYLNRQVRGLVDLQLLTGARGGELFKLRPIDIQMDDKKGIWMVNPTNHKMAHAGKSRTIYIGPRAQTVIQPFLADRPVDSCLFNPAEAERERREALSKTRKTPHSCGNGLGTNRVPSPRKQPGQHYTAASYRKAVQRACEQAGVPAWHPHQLRHNAATTIRRDFGLEAASIALGHASGQLTDATYAMRDEETVIHVMQMIG